MQAALRIIPIENLGENPLNHIRTVEGGTRPADRRTGVIRSGPFVLSNQFRCPGVIRDPPVDASVMFAGARTQVQRVAVPHDKHLSGQVNSQSRIVGIKAGKPVCPPGTGIYHVMYPSIIVRNCLAPIFNICQMPGTGRVHHQAGTLVDVDTEIFAGPYRRGTD